MAEPETFWGVQDFTEDFSWRSDSLCSILKCTCKQEKYCYEFDENMM